MDWGCRCRRALSSFYLGELERKGRGKEERSKEEKERERRPKRREYMTTPNVLARVESTF